MIWLQSLLENYFKVRSQVPTFQMFYSRSSLVSSLILSNEDFAMSKATYASSRACQLSSNCLFVKL